MNIKNVILGHRNWKTRLSDYIYAPDKSLKPESCHERTCELTKWLSSDEAHSLFTKHELTELQKAHKAYHHILGEIVFNTNNGVQISEEMALGIDSHFNRHLETLARLLSKAEKEKTQDNGSDISKSA